MLKIRIIPCLDVADGRVVKGVNFVNLKDAGDPVEAAYRYDQAGADEICFLDINATYKNRNTTYDMVRKTAEKCFIPLTVGGGVRTVEDVRKLLLAGADKVSFNSAAVANPEIITAAANQFGSQCIVCAIDAKLSILKNGNYLLMADDKKLALMLLSLQKKLPIWGLEKFCLLRWIKMAQNRALT